MKTFCQSQEFLLFPKLILVSGLLTSGFYCLFLRLSRICFFLFHTPPPFFCFLFLTGSHVHILSAGISSIYHMLCLMQFWGLNLWLCACYTELHPTLNHTQIFSISEQGEDMPSAKQLADIGYKTFSASMMLLTVYGGYLCSVRAYRYLQLRSARRQAAEEQKTSGVL